MKSFILLMLISAQSFAICNTDRTLCIGQGILEVDETLLAEDEFEIMDGGLLGDPTPGIEGFSKEEMEALEL